MGIIDDLAMGLGFKARTEDYDARTARTLRDVQGNAAAADQYLGSRGYDEGYRPQIAQDDRPFMQRLFTSPESQYSPTPYAIGPVRMNQAMSPLGPMGLLMRMMGGGSTKPTAEDIAFIRSIPQQEIGGGLLTEPAPMPTSVDTGVVGGEGDVSSMTFPMLDEYNVPASDIPSMTFPMLDQYNVPPSAPTPPSSAMTTPIEGSKPMNFAQVIRKSEERDGKFYGRTGQPKSYPLDVLKRAYDIYLQGFK